MKYTITSFFSTYLKLIILTFLILMTFVTIHCQNGIIKGRVFDNINNEEAKIKILRISIYCVENLNLLTPTQVEIINAINTPKNPEVIDRKNEFNAAR